MSKINGKRIQIFLSLLLVMMAFSCVSNMPPERIQHAIRTVNDYLPEYAFEANRALENMSHPESERLVGTGILLVEVLEALGQWADGKKSKLQDDEQ